MASRVIPPLLEPYLALPDEAALIVLTGILGANTNWLALRYLHSFLKSSPSSSAPIPASRRDGYNGETELQNGMGEAKGNQVGETSVILLSFLRDFAFWKDAAARLGLDLEAQGRKGRFGFVDGLTGLFSGGASTATTSTSTAATPGNGPGAGAGAFARTGGTSPAASPSTRGIPLRPQVPQVSQRSPAVPGASAWNPQKWTLTSPALADVSGMLHGAVDELAGKGNGKGRVVLVIDQLDFLLAASPSAGDVSVLALRELLLDLREVCPSTHPSLSLKGARLLT